VSGDPVTLIGYPTESKASSLVREALNKKCGERARVTQVFRIGSATPHSPNDHPGHIRYLKDKILRCSEQPRAVPADALQSRCKVIGVNFAILNGFALEPASVRYADKLVK